MSHTQVAGQAVGQHRNNEGVLHEHANPLWTVLQHSLDGLFIVDVQPANAASNCCEDTDRVEAPEFRFVAANPASRQMLLVTTEDPVGLRLHECLPEGIAGTTAKHLRACLEQRQSIEYEAIFDTRTDSAGDICNNIRHLLTRLSPVFSQDGRNTKIIGLCQDLTEYRRVEAQAQLLQTIALAIAAAKDFQTALSIALHYCCEATGWNYGEAWIPNPETAALQCSPACYISTNDLLMFSQISQGLQFPKGIGLPGRVWLSKQPEWHQDVSIESESIFLRAQLAMSWGLKAGLGVPIIAGDQVLAVLVFFMFESRPADRRMVELVSAVAAQLGTLMQRKQAEDALRESQRKLAHLINSLPGFVFSCASDPEWSMNYLSEGVFNLIEYHSKELAGKSRLISYSDLTHPEDLPNVLKAIARAIAKKQPYVVYRIRTKSGLEKWLWEKGSGVFDNMGNVLAIEGFITDITERKQTEEALKAQAQVLESMAEGVSVADENGMITFTNPAFDAMFGYERGELQGKHFSTLNVYPILENARLTVKIIEQLNKQGSWLGEFNNLKKDKTVFTTYAHISALEMSGKRYWVCVQEDITERKRAEVALKQAEEKYRSIFENAVEGIFQTTPEGRYLTANPMLARIYGYDSPVELMASLTDIQHQLYVNPDRRSQFSRLLQEQDAVLDFESEIYRKDGSTIWISENARAIRDTGGTLLGYEGTVVDITQRKQAEAELVKRDNLLQGVAEAMNYLLTDTNHGSAIVKALTTLGIAAGVDRVYICQNHPHPVTGEPAMSMRFEWVRALIEPMLNKPHWQNLAYRTHLCRWYDSLSANQPIRGNAVEFPAGERQRLEADGIVSILMVPVLVNNEFWGYVGFDDCHRERGWSKSEESILVAIAASIGGALQRHQQEETIRHQALHDRLTGLPNRQLLDIQLALALETAANRRHKLAIIFLDLDRFKIINDTLGHAVGDQLLQTAAQRLKSCLREEDTIVRWGGDEFIALLPHLNSLEDALHIAQRIIDALQPAFEIEGHQLYITCSIGIALYPNDGEDAETLIKNADTALYRAKERGRNNYQIFTPSMNAEASALLVLDNSLHLAFERGEFLVHYQPQLNTNTGEITCMEALVRWQHPERGLMMPEAFIPLAEENGLMIPLGKWVLQTACAQNQAWQKVGLPAMRVAVNLSTRQFQQPSLVAMVGQVLEQTGLEPQYLQLEITETTAMLDSNFTSDTLGELKAMGICLSMDNFGIGHASLSGLKNFPFHTLKIDRAFVRDMTSDLHDSAIVKAIFSLGHALNFCVVTEGVETQAQKQLLQSLHCQEMQGYLFSKPLTAGEATDFVITINSKSPRG